MEPLAARPLILACGKDLTDLIDLEDVNMNSGDRYQTFSCKERTLYRACDMLKTTVEVCSPQIPIYWLHCSDFRMHCTNDKVDTFVMLGMMVTSTNVIGEVGGRC